MTPEEAERLARLAQHVAREAGSTALAGYRKGVKIERKQATELVTQYDFESERVIRERLASIGPPIPLVAEEAGGTFVGDRVWYADPIDGTTNFAHGHPFWAVSIGLVVGGVPVLGTVVAPALGIEWLGWRGGPALRNGEPCRVSDTGELRDSLLATGFPYDRQTSPDNNLDAFGAMQKRAVGIRRCGSAAIDLCLVADGTYDGYWEKKLRPWDIAAGIALVYSAGGRATSFVGGPPDLLQGHVIASNGRIHEALFDALRDASGATLESSSGTQ
jgi:myo-inositol-1(or 4)-monophosphatase